jgi:hypothetical protein
MIEIGIFFVREFYGNANLECFSRNFEFDFLILEFFKFFLEFLPEENFGDFYKILIHETLMEKSCPSAEKTKMNTKMKHQISFILSFLRH